MGYSINRWMCDITATNAVSMDKPAVNAVISDDTCTDYPASPLHTPRVPPTFTR